MTVYKAVKMSVMQHIAQGEPFTIRQIHELTGEKLDSVETSVRRLEKEGYVTKLGPRKRVGPGRPQDYYQITSDYKKRRDLLNELRAFEIEIPASESPTGVHYPFLVEEINQLVQNPDEEPISEEVEEILDYLWDVYLEEGEEEASEAVKMHLRFQELRIKLLGNRIESEDAAQELNDLQAFFLRHKQRDAVREIKSFLLIMKARQNYSNSKERNLPTWIGHLLQSLKEYFQQGAPLALQTALRALDQIRDSYDGLVKDKALLQNTYDQLAQNYARLERENEGLQLTLERWRSLAENLQRKAQEEEPAPPSPLARIRAFSRSLIPSPRPAPAMTGFGYAHEPEPALSDFVRGSRVGPFGPTSSGSTEIPGTAFQHFGKPEFQAIQPSKPDLRHFEGHTVVSGEVDRIRMLNTALRDLKPTEFPTPSVNTELFPSYQAPSAQISE